MAQRLILALVALTVVGATADLAACGDKFLRAGRSSRMKGYAAVYPASILVYAPYATPKGLSELENLLNRAGHKSVSVRTEAGLARALAATKLDVVLTPYDSVAAVQARFAPGTEPGVLPILDDPSDAQVKEATKRFHCLLKLEKMTKFEALEEIDHLMELRRTSQQAAAAR